MYSTQPDVGPGAPFSKAVRQGWMYKDKAGSSAGIMLVKEKAGKTGTPKEPKIFFKGKGTSLPDPSVPVPTPGDVDVQVINSSNANCFGDSYADGNVQKKAAKLKHTVRIMKMKNSQLPIAETAAAT